MSSTPRSLVVGAYSSIPPSLLQPFVSSLRATGFAGDVCVIAGRSSAEDLRQLDELFDEVISVAPSFPEPPRLLGSTLWRVRSTRGVRRAYARAFGIGATALGRSGGVRLEHYLEGLQALRYHLYHRLISERAPEPDYVMLSDLRDVVFQRDPFEDQVETLELYLEDPVVRIGYDDFNTRWIRDLYGNGAVEELRGEPVSCSGTVVGTRDAVLTYLETMADELARHRGPLGSHDQGVHNVLLHRGRLPAHRLVDNERGRVLTMGRMDHYRSDSNGRVLNADDSVAPVLHQWDRHLDLAARIEQQWAAGA